MLESYSYILTNYWKHLCSYFLNEDQKLRIFWNVSDETLHSDFLKAFKVFKYFVRLNYWRYYVTFAKHENLTQLTLSHIFTLSTIGITYHNTTFWPMIEVPCEVFCWTARTWWTTWRAGWARSQLFLWFPTPFILAAASKMTAGETNSVSQGNDFTKTFTEHIAST